MANRKQRRAANKALPARQKMSQEDKMNALLKNGITVEYVDKECKRHYNAGYEKGAEHSFKMIYAALCLAANDLFGFGKKRCRDLLLATDQYVLTTFTTEEAIDAVFKRMGLHISVTDNEMERIQEV